MTRRAQIAETLRDLILTGRIAPGSQLVEQTLASRFGVSRGSIREAIWELVDQGIVTNRPYAGTFVIDLDVKTMHEVYSVRGALERHCFLLIWPRRDAAYREEFTARHAALVEAIQGDKRVEAIRAELHFHSFPYEYSANGVLLDVWRQLSTKTQLSFAMSQGIVRGEDFLEETNRYLAAALGDDIEMIHREIDRHLQLGIEAIGQIDEARRAG
jgi:DNA-binding GntR family transcriptional regulator